MRTFKVKNFERFQHYKDRAPPWIKLYNELLDDYEFGRLQDASKMHLIAIWLLASRSENKIPYDPDWISRRINATDSVDLDALERAGFIVVDQEVQSVEQDASNTLAKCLSRGETEERQRREENAPNGAYSKVYFFDQPPIRLKEADFRKWESAFPRLDLAAELTALAGWAGEQRDWFHAVSGALAKRNRQQKQIAENASRGVTMLTPSGNPWPEGIL